MKKTLIPLILIIIVLSWNFIFTEKKLGLTDQARVLQGLSMAIAYKTAIADYWGKTGALPDIDAWRKEKSQINPDLSQTIVHSIRVAEDGPGVISVFYTAKQDLESPQEIEGKKINLIPGVQAGKLVWDCRGTFTLELLPSRCSKLISQ